MSDKNLIENEHALTTPELIGTDQEKIAGIKFWSDVIGLIRTINTTFVSYENKKSIIAAFKKELDVIEVEIDNSSSRVTQGTTDIPSADQVPKDEPSADVNVVDLTKNAEVAATTVGAVKVQPTFSSLDKLRRMAGNNTTFVPENKTILVTAEPTFTDNLEKLRRAAGAGKYGIHHADKK